MDASGTHLRVVRAALFTALVVTLSVTSHVLLSRAPLPLTVVGLTSGAVFSVAYVLAGRERGFGAIAGLLVPLELAADTVFTSGQNLCYGAAGGPITGSLRSVGVDVLCGNGGIGPAAATTGDAGGALGPVSDSGHAAAALLASPGPAVPWLLLAAHVAVGLLAAAWLRHGESGLAALLRAAAATAFRPLLVAVAAAGAAARPVRPGVRPAGRPGPLLPARLLVHSVGRRGPPRSAGVFA
ncbi:MULTISPECIES: hypothetical protein [unclassified Streptomyces]|uniref:hypothetical protein n=3 Tax=Streptomyces TaxID=1883 RepID=UPI0001C1A23F|nr:MULTISPECIES: hypothetical protein [unclassified Streptomyces]AEN09412.1 conserved hypothetical protein [Streptomyces sp. SirexAA-E]MYT64730.1 hypothetical protein [Streptomyces sp. SID8357]MYT87724.1 hypothetical protein [Streptomyces sp. SID8360]MYU34995.1 hypothetical protein [Streptomyces sp. SID8358]MYW36894.1 hypothetical protein [Streptomyces sp. SID1]